MATAHMSAKQSKNQLKVSVNLLAAIFGDQRIKGFKEKVNETQYQKLCLATLMQFQLSIFYKSTSLQKNFHGRVLAIWHGYFPH